MRRVIGRDGGMDLRMIKFKLTCDTPHVFEAWFQSGSAYDTQVKRGMVACPECGSTRVEKALMAPNVVTHSRRAPQEAAAGDRQAVATMPEPRTGSEQKVLALMRQLREEVRRHADYVGPRFAEEARRMHFDEAPSRGIYGEASAAEAASLLEDGIAVLPLPVLPEDHD